MRKTISLGRVHDFHSKDPEVYAILFDRLWPRGLKKEHLPIDLWAKDWSPSPGLRQLFHDGKIEFSRFRMSYMGELQDKKQEIQDFLTMVLPQKILLLFASRDLHENNAVVLKETLDGWSSKNQDHHQKTHGDRKD